MRTQSGIAAKKHHIRAGAVLGAVTLRKALHKTEAGKEGDDAVEKDRNQKQSQRQITFQGLLMRGYKYRNGNAINFFSQIIF